MHCPVNRVGTQHQWNEIADWYREHKYFYNKSEYNLYLKFCMMCTMYPLLFSAAFNRCLNSMQQKIIHITGLWYDVFCLFFTHTHTHSINIPLFSHQSKKKRNNMKTLHSDCVSSTKNNVPVLGLGCFKGNDFTTCDINWFLSQ